MPFLYTIWCLFWFFFSFFLLYPFFWILIQKKTWHRYTHWVYKAWGKFFFFISFIPVRNIWFFKPLPNQNYIYVANHSSLLDIALMITAVPNFSTFVGKSSVGKVPLFGYKFKKLHIPVDRSETKSRILTYERMKKALKDGKNLLIYPEGGIFSENPPLMIPFKEGAFKAAIETQTPLVPVSILGSWRVLPDKSPVRFHRHRCTLLFHEPIDTKNKTLDEVEAFKMQVFQIIDADIKTFLENGNRYEKSV